MKSMTGYGNASYRGADINLEVELKSVNGRFFDLRLYMPRELNSLESEIEGVIKKYIGRGKVELRINYEDLREPNVELDINRFKAYIEVCRQAMELSDKDQDIPLPYILKEKGVIRLEQSSLEEVRIRIISTVKEAAENHTVMALKEAKAMSENMEISIQKCHDALDNIEKSLPEFRDKLYDRTKKAVEDHLIDKLDDDGIRRIMVEVALYIEKYDINEEITRLRDHMKRFSDKIRSKRIEIGKSLNFILQEMHREINTIGSKFNNREVFQDILTIKEEVEKCREMVQNIQ